MIKNKKVEPLSEEDELGEDIEHTDNESDSMYDGSEEELKDEDIILCEVCGYEDCQCGKEDIKKETDLICDTCNICKLCKSVKGSSRCYYHAQINRLGWCYCH